MAGFEAKKVLSGLLQNKEGSIASGDSVVSPAVTKPGINEEGVKEIAANLAAIRRNTTSDDQTSLAHQDKQQHNELVRVLKKGFGLDEWASATTPPSQANQNNSSSSFSSMFGSGAGMLGSALFGATAASLGRKVGRALSKALGLSLRGLKSIPGVGALIATISGLVTNGTKAMGTAGSLLKKLMWPVAALSAAFDGWKGWDAEKAKELFGSDSVSAKIGSSISHIVSGLLLDLVSPEQIANGLKQVGNIGGEVGDFLLMYSNRVLDQTKKIIGEENLTKIAESLAAPINWLFEQSKSIGSMIEAKASAWTPDWVKSGWNSAKDFVLGSQVAASPAPTKFIPLDTPGYNRINGSLPVPTQSVSRSGSSLADAIAKHESRGDYNVFNRGAGNGYKIDRQDFSSMTLDEVLAQQNLGSKDPNRLFAVGKYQIIPQTLEAAKKALELDGSTKFTPELQDRIFAEYLSAQKRPDIDKYIRTGQGLEAAKLAGAQEWASIGVESKGDKSYYAGDGINKAHMSSKEFEDHLRQANMLYVEAINSGASESEAIRVAKLGPSKTGTTNNQVRVASVSSISSEAPVQRVSGSSPEFSAPPMPVPATLAPTSVVQTQENTSSGPELASSGGGSGELSLSTIPAVPNDERLALINLGLT